MTSASPGGPDHSPVARVAAAVLTDLGAPAGRLRVSGSAPVLPSCFAVDVAAAAAVGAAGLAAAALWRLRGGAPSPAGGAGALTGAPMATAVEARAGAEGDHPDAGVDMRHAAVAFRSERYLRVDGQPASLWADLSGDYRTGDGWVRLHANYPAHRAAIVRALRPARDDRAGVAAAVAHRPAVEVEDAVIAAGGAAAAMRTRDTWAAHPQGNAVAGAPLIGLTRIGDAPPRPLSPADRPLETVRVLDVTRVIAGPVAGRVLAGYGADVLRVGADHLALVPAAAVDTGFGKRFCHVDLRTGDGRAALRDLIAGADVLVQAYRPGALAALGFGPAECAALRPGLVYVSISAWGREGPWRTRRGFDSLVQMACGIAAEGAEVTRADHPVPLPAQTLDHGTGWLAALAAVEGLRRRHSLGGSWHAELSLARTAAWLDSLGRLDGGFGTPEPDPADLLSTMDSVHGRLTYVRPPGTVAGWAPRWDTPPPAPGADPPQWTVNRRP
jgi:crotonobetainyl-CoA:carnitine CoA-transferase CaiB-like acyl-CoA transferase